MNTVDNQKKAVSERIKAARKAIGHTQKSFCETFGMALPSLKNYEGSNQMPGGEAISVFVEAGVNANWLLTGEGPMLLAELAPPVTKSVIAGINVDALEAIIEGALRITPNGKPSQIASFSARLYKDCIDNGMITPDGVGPGNLSSAA